MAAYGDYAYYYRFTGEWEKEIDAYQQAVRDNYPRPWSFHNQLALTYNDLGKFEDGLREGLEAIRLNPTRRLLTPAPWTPTCA